MAKPKLTSKEEKFAQAYIARTGDKVQAYKDAGYSITMSSAAISSQADKLYNKPKINLRIKELQEKASVIANKAFSVSVEQRVKWLEEVALAGLSDYADQGGNMRKENLAATCKAVDVLNSMLGTQDLESKTIKPIPIGIVDAS